MFAINKITPIKYRLTKPISKEPPLSSIEKQHINFLDSLYANENISQPLHSYDEALALLTPFLIKIMLKINLKLILCQQ